MLFTTSFAIATSISLLEAIELINLEDSNVQYYNRQDRMMRGQYLEHTLADYLVKFED